MESLEGGSFPFQNEFPDVRKSGGREGGNRGTGNLFSKEKWGSGEGSNRKGFAMKKKGHQASTGRVRRATRQRRESDNQSPFLKKGERG